MKNDIFHFLKKLNTKTKIYVKIWNNII